MLMLAWVLLLQCCSAYSYRDRSEATDGLFEQNQGLELVNLENKITEETAKVRSFRHFSSGASSSKSSTPVALELPRYLIASPSKDHKEVFNPEKHARHLPPWAVNMLLGRPSNILTPELVSDPKKIVEIQCPIDKMHVRVNRGAFKTLDAYKYLKLGTCPVNKGTKSHYYLLYHLTTDCGFKYEVKCFPSSF